MNDGFIHSLFPEDHDGHFNSTCSSGVIRLALDDDW